MPRIIITSDCYLETLLRNQVCNDCMRQADHTKQKIIFPFMWWWNCFKTPCLLKPQSDNMAIFSFDVLRKLYPKFRETTSLSKQLRCEGKNPSWRYYKSSQCCKANKEITRKLMKWQCQWNCFKNKIRKNLPWNKTTLSILHNFIGNEKSFF